MELRRALLLFAIVLGLAAIVTAVARPPERAQRDEGGSDRPAEPATPAATPFPDDDAPASISFSATEPRTRRLEAGRAATVTVKVPARGQVELATLGLNAAAEPLTPARFEVLESRPGRHEIRFTPARGAEARSVGALQIVR